MRMAMVALAVAGLVAGCGAAVPGGAQPREVRLSDSVLTVTLTDGSMCRADWQAAGGAGRLEPCGAGYDYRVIPEAKANPLRQVFVGLSGALGLEGAVSPLAEVVLTSSSGRDWRFASPPPVE